jgi:hypothetical protein
MHVEVMRDDLISGDVFYFKDDPMYVLEVSEGSSGLTAYGTADEEGARLRYLRTNSLVVVVHNTMGNRC